MTKRITPFIAGIKGGADPKWVFIERLWGLTLYHPKVSVCGADDRAGFARESRASPVVSRWRSGAKLDESFQGGHELVVGHAHQGVESGSDEGAARGGDASADGALKEEVKEGVIVRGKGERGPDDGLGFGGGFGQAVAVGGCEAAFNGRGFIVEAAFEALDQGIGFGHAGLSLRTRRSSSVRAETSAAACRARGRSETVTPPAAA